MKLETRNSKLETDTAFLASYYSRLADYHRDRRKLRNLTFTLFLVGCAITIPGHIWDSELLRTVGVIPFLIAAVTGSAYLVYSTIIRALKRQLEGADLPAPGLSIRPLKPLDDFCPRCRFPRHLGPCKHPSVPSVPLW